MAHPHKTRRAAAALFAGLLASLALAGCGKKQVAVDPGRVLEGENTGVSRLIMNPNLGIIASVRVSDPGGSGGTVLVPIALLYLERPGLPKALLLDNSTAGAFTIHASDAQTGAHEILPFPLRPYVRWLDGGWEAYDATLPGGGRQDTYQGRGLIQGAVTARSPLTNQARVDALPATFAVRIGHGDPDGDPLPFTDSLFTLIWDPVPGAASYLIHVFQPRSDSRDRDKADLVVPRPIGIGKTRDYFVGILPGTAVRYTLGDPGATILTRRQTFKAQVYFARVTALDAQGRMLAIGVPAASFPGEDTYGIFEYPQASLPAVLPGDVAEQLAAMAFAISPDAQVSLEILALRVETQSKLPETAPPPVFHAPLPSSPWADPPPLPVLVAGGAMQ